MSFPCCDLSVLKYVILLGCSPDRLPSWSGVAILLDRADLSNHVMEIVTGCVMRCFDCRRDSARVFSYEEVSKWGAAGQILLERLLPELAFKLGRASKYGA